MPEGQPVSLAGQMARESHPQERGPLPPDPPPPASPREGVFQATDTSPNTATSGHALATVTEAS